MESRARVLIVAGVSLTVGYLLSSAIVKPSASSLEMQIVESAMDSANALVSESPSVEEEEGVASEILGASSIAPLIEPVLTHRVERRLLPDIEPEPDPAVIAAVVPEASVELAISELPPVEEVGTERPRFAPLAPPGELTRMTWHAGESLYGAPITTPVLVAQGTQSGPVLCLTAAVHGDELNGIETVRQVMYAINNDKLRGRVIGVPIVNLQGFQRHSRYLPDRRDLNRFFPGNTHGSSAARMAHAFFDGVVRSCDALVDLHTGSFHRTNLPQVRADLNNEAVVELTQGFASTVVLHSSGGDGTLRRAAVNAGIPAVTLEAGEPLRVDADAVEHSVEGLFALMEWMDMYGKRSLRGNPEPRYYNSLWVRADKGGMLMGKVKLGKRVRAGDELGTVTDPITNEQQVIYAPHHGRVIGMALNQFVMPGYAAFHLGTEAGSLETLPDILGPEDAANVDHLVPSGDAASVDHSIAGTPPAAEIEDIHE